MILHQKVVLVGFLLEVLMELLVQRPLLLLLKMLLQLGHVGLLLAWVVVLLLHRPLLVGIILLFERQHTLLLQELLLMVGTQVRVVNIWITSGFTKLLLRKP